MEVFGALEAGYSDQLVNSAAIYLQYPQGHLDRGNDNLAPSGGLLLAMMENMESRYQELLALALDAEEQKLYAQAEDYLNDAVAQAAKVNVGSVRVECFVKLSQFLRRRGRLDEANNLDSIAELIASKSVPQSESGG